MYSSTLSRSSTLDGGG